MGIELGIGFLVGIFNFLLTRASNDVITKIHELRKYKRKLEVLETTILNAENESKKLETFLLEGRLKTVVQDRLDTLTLLCYDAEDLIEDIALLITKNTTPEKKKLNFATKLKSPDPFLKIRKLQEKIDEIIAQLKMLIPDDSKKEDKVKLPDWGNSSTSCLVGRQDDINAIIEKLFSKINNGVCIVGMPGVGKTALALNILENPRISDNFQISKVHVQDGIFNPKDSITELLNCKEKALKNKKSSLLIMFDRLLNVKRLVDWDDFLSKGREMRNINIKILVTTVTPRVSEILKTFEYTLKPLLKDDCQKVIVQKGIVHDLERRRFLERTANIMVNNCGGLPGVAKFLGIILGTCKMQEWTPFNLWDLQEFRDEIYPILSWAYSYKQHYMTRCLVYFALFPEEYDYNVDYLVQLWAAEGFVEQVQEGKISFNDIVQRSILQPSDEQNSIYKLHKFNHYLSKLAASRIFLQFPPGSSTSLLIESVRHLSLLCDIDKPLLKKLEKCKRLRTLLSLSNPITDVKVTIPPSLFKKLKYLRVLALNRTNIENIPESIDNLEHLRFLDLSYTLIDQLPDQLCKLRNLQFLKIKDTKLRQLPKDFENLTNLRYVDWEIAEMRKLKPGNIGTLSHLETLPFFRVSKEPEFAIKQLENMSSLQGSISITGLENVESEEKSEEAKLCGKDKLKSIELEWTKRSSVCEQVLNGLKPHDNLKELVIKNYNSAVFPNWMSNPSLLLEKIHLNTSPSCDTLPPLAELQCLETLFFEEFPMLKSVKSLFHEVSTTKSFISLKSLTLKSMAKLWDCTYLESNVLPSLCILKILSCPELENLPTLEDFTSLHTLEIEDCPELNSLPDLPKSSLRSLIVRNCNVLKDRCEPKGQDWPKFQHVPHVEIDGKVVRSPSDASNAVPASRNQQIDGTPPDWVFQGHILDKNNEVAIFGQIKECKESEVQSDEEEFASACDSIDISSPADIDDEVFDSAFASTENCL
ncbi:hypothetical protein BVRB_3g063990 [Beta vulgaris subsp. vulgaris]|nr:hypothetical protein BVRB_3g063990 [Beta vulgaris subsp. vulgaris]